MARQTSSRNISPTLAAAEQWVNACLIEDRSLFSETPLWTARLVDEVHHAFVDNPDFGKADFIAKLKGQMGSAPPAAQQLMAEMLWALLLFPSNIKASTKRRQVREIWALSGQQLSDSLPLMADNVLSGIGSGGPGFNNYRPEELTFLITLTRDLKRRNLAERKQIFSDYYTFFDWIKSVPQEGRRQFRHMLRFFSFPDRVERMSSNNERRRVLEGFGIAAQRVSKKWTDRELDQALFKLRGEIEGKNPSTVVDFYESGFKEVWSPNRRVKTIDGEVTVVVPRDDDEEDDGEEAITDIKPPEARLSLQVQAKLSEIGRIMGFKVWLPRADRARIRELVAPENHHAFLDDLPLNYDEATLDTIEQIDVLWLRGRSIARAFEVEHSTAVYSGLLRMADLLALQPNMDIKLHIVAPDERREKVFHEMLRPVFSLLDRGPLSQSCTFISYDSVDAIRALEHLSYTNDSIITEYEEKAEA